MIRLFNTGDRLIHSARSSQPARVVTFPPDPIISYLVPRSSFPASLRDSHYARPRVSSLPSRFPFPPFIPIPPSAALPSPFIESPHLLIPHPRRNSTCTIPPISSSRTPQTSRSPTPSLLHSLQLPNSSSPRIVQIGVAVVLVTSYSASMIIRYLCMCGGKSTFRCSE